MATAAGFTAAVTSTGVDGLVTLPITGLATAGPEAAGFEVAGLDVATLDAGTLDTGALDAGALDAGALDVANLEEVTGLEVTGLEVAGLETTVFSAAFAVFFSISLLLFLEDFAADGLADEGLVDEDLVDEALTGEGLTGENLVLDDLALDGLLTLDGLPAAGLTVDVLPPDDLTEPRAALAESRATPPRTRLLGVLRLVAVVFPAPFKILFLRGFCDTTCARIMLAPLFKFFHENLSGPKRRREQGPAC